MNNHPRISVSQIIRCETFVTTCRTVEKHKSVVFPPETLDWRQSLSLIYPQYSFTDSKFYAFFWFLCVFFFSSFSFQHFFFLSILIYILKICYGDLLPIRTPCYAPFIADSSGDSRPERSSRVALSLFLLLFLRLRRCDSSSSLILLVVSARFDHRRDT